MSMPKYLPLTCGHCRRTLRVRSAYLGQMVTCNRCDHQFIAAEEPSSRSASSSDESSSLVERVTEVDRLQRCAEDLVAIRAERDQALGQVARLQAELDCSAERESEWERTLGENECRHRTEIDGLAHELRIASTQASLAAQREHTLAEQLQIAQKQLDDVAQQLAVTETERDRLAQERAETEIGLRSTHDEHRDQLDSLRYDLQEARRSEQIALERETELLGQIQDLRGKLDLYDEKLEAERRGHQEGSTVLAIELEAMFRQKLADECLRSATLEQRLEELSAKHSAEPALTVKPLETDGSPPPNHPAHSAGPIVAADATTAPRPEDSPGAENAKTTPLEHALGPPIWPDSDTAVETDPDADRIARPEPLAAESPEARILDLRKSLRVAHEARAKGSSRGPFFARLARMWKRSGSAQ